MPKFFTNFEGRRAENIEPYLPARIGCGVLTEPQLHPTTASTGIPLSPSFSPLLPCEESGLGQQRASTSFTTGRNEDSHLPSTSDELAEGLSYTNSRRKGWGVASSTSGLCPLRVYPQIGADEWS